MKKDQTLMPRDREEWDDQKYGPNPNQAAEVDIMSDEIIGQSSVTGNPGTQGQQGMTYDPSIVQPLDE